MRTSLISNIPGVWPLPSAGVALDPVIVTLSSLVAAGILSVLFLGVEFLLRWMRKPVPAPYSGVGAVQPHLAGRHAWDVSGPLIDADDEAASKAGAIERAWGN